MKILKANIEGIETAIISSLLIRHDWLICCTTVSGDPNDPHIIFENVTRYETAGYFERKFRNPVFIEYGISPVIDGDYQYRIHDSLMQPILNGKAVTDLVASMIKVFDLFIIDENLVDRRRVYGKLGTKQENEIVFINDKI